MTTTWSFLFFLVMTLIFFLLSPWLLLIATTLFVLYIIGMICQWNLERTGRVPKGHFTH